MTSSEMERGGKATREMSQATHFTGKATHFIEKEATLRNEGKHTSRKMVKGYNRVIGVAQESATIPVREECHRGATSRSTRSSITSRHHQHLESSCGREKMMGLPRERPNM